MRLKRTQGKAYICCMLRWDQTVPKNDKASLYLIHFTLSEPPYYHSFRRTFYKIHDLLRPCMSNLFLFSPLSPLVFWFFMKPKGLLPYSKEPKTVLISSQMNPLHIHSDCVALKSVSTVSQSLTTYVFHLNSCSVFRLNYFNHFSYSRVCRIPILSCHFDLNILVEINL